MRFETRALLRGGLTWFFAVGFTVLLLAAASAFRESAVHPIAMVIAPFLGGVLGGFATGWRHAAESVTAMSRSATYLYAWTVLPAWLLFGACGGLFAVGQQGARTIGDGESYLEPFLYLVAFPAIGCAAGAAAGITARRMKRGV